MSCLIDSGFNDTCRGSSGGVGTVYLGNFPSGITQDSDKNSIGEGIVWVGWHNGNRHVFKTKGAKHKISGKKSKIVEISPEKLNSIKEFVQYSVTENRLNQGIEQVFITNSEIPAITGMGKFIKWIHQDIIKEETDVLGSNKLEPKDVNKYISIAVKDWFIKFLDKQAGL